MVPIYTCEFSGKKIHSFYRWSLKQKQLCHRVIKITGVCNVESCIKDNNEFMCVHVCSLRLCQTASLCTLYTCPFNTRKRNILSTYVILWHTRVIERKCLQAHRMQMEGSRGERKGWSTNGMTESPRIQSWVKSSAWGENLVRERKGKKGIVRKAQLSLTYGISFI